MPLQQIGRILNQAFAQIKADVQQISPSSNPLDSFDGAADIAVAGGGQSLLGGGWVVQAFVFDGGDSRHIELVALGDSGFGRAMQGIRNSLSLSKSSEQMAFLADQLRAADSAFIAR